MKTDALLFLRWVYRMRRDAWNAWKAENVVRDNQYRVRLLGQMEAYDKIIDQIRFMIKKRRSQRKKP